MRYENAAQFFELIKSKKRLSGEGATRKASYESNLSDISKEISDAVDGIATLDDVQMDAVNSIVRSAAKFWIETCSQRYRIVMVMPDDATDVLNLSRAPMTMKLLVQPGLNRMGNARGEELTKEETVSNLKLQLSEEYGKSKSGYK